MYHKINEVKGNTRNIKANTNEIGLFIQTFNFSLFLNSAILETEVIFQ
jgi:hypothetical protein